MSTRDPDAVARQRTRLVEAARERADREARWAEESTTTGVPVAELRARFHATPEGATDGWVHARLTEAPPATEEQAAVLRALFRPARRRRAGDVA